MNELSRGIFSDRKINILIASLSGFGGLLAGGLTLYLTGDLHVAAIYAGTTTGIGGAVLPITSHLIGRSTN